jgi:transposase-like protein
LKVTPTAVVTDKAPGHPCLLDELVRAAWHHVERHENNWIEADHSRLNTGCDPCAGLRTDRTPSVIIAGLAFTQDLRRGHYELVTEAPRRLRVAAAFAELATRNDTQAYLASACPSVRRSGARRYCFRYK